jgi:SAM-dependent methyltransferase
MAHDSVNRTHIVLWDGAAQEYDAVRPHPPEALLDILTQLAEVERPRLVVDLGSGTGLSTLVWVERADDIIGVEPNDDMRAQAEGEAQRHAQRALGGTHVGNVRFVAGVSSATGLPDECADIVTASQALHWMEPESTFAEVARVLRPGGVFAAYDYDWPPTINVEVELAYAAFMERLAAARHAALAAGRDLEAGLARTPKREQLTRMRQSGRFCLVKEVLVDSIDQGDAERIARLALTALPALWLRQGWVTEEELGVAELRAAVRAAMGDEPWRWYWSYRVRLGVKGRDT